MSLSQEDIRAIAEEIVKLSSTKVDERVSMNEIQKAVHKIENRLRIKSSIKLDLNGKEFSKYSEIDLDKLEEMLNDLGYILQYDDEEYLVVSK